MLSDIMPSVIVPIVIMMSVVNADSNSFILKIVMLNVITQNAIWQSVIKLNDAMISAVCS